MSTYVAATASLAGVVPEVEIVRRRSLVVIDPVGRDCSTVSCLHGQVARITLNGLPKNIGYVVA